VIDARYWVERVADGCAISVAGYDEYEDAKDECDRFARLDASADWDVWDEAYGAVRYMP